MKAAARYVIFSMPVRDNLLEPLVSLYSRLLNYLTVLHFDNKYTRMQVILQNYYYHLMCLWCGLLVLGGFIRPVMRVSTQTWIVKYYWTLQFRNNVINIKTKNWELCLATGQQRSLWRRYCPLETFGSS